VNDLEWTLIFDRLTVKLVSKPHLTWGTFNPNLATFDHLRVLKLFAMYATDGQTDEQTDGQTDKSNAYCPLSYGRVHNNANICRTVGTDSVAVGISS